MSIGISRLFNKDSIYYYIIAFKFVLQNFKPIRSWFEKKTFIMEVNSK